MNERHTSPSKHKNYGCKHHRREKETKATLRECSKVGARVANGGGRRERGIPFVLNTKVNNIE